jgi:uncharacterized protein (TIGR01244 family)
MTLTIQRMNADVAVAGQLDPAAMAEAAAAGFRSVVNNRPDFEGGPTQPTSASVAAGLAERTDGRGHRPLRGTARVVAEADPRLLPHGHALGQAGARGKRGLTAGPRRGRS